MTTYVALLRAVNVGGTGKLSMADLRALCESAGFSAVRTFIASGNVVFQAAHSHAEVLTALESRLAMYAKKPVGVLVRTSDEMEAVLASNPFAGEPSNRVVTLFLSSAPPRDTLDQVRGRDNERVVLGHHEIYVHYPDGMGKSRLIIPPAKNGTARNMNTVAKLVAMASA